MELSKLDQMNLETGRQIQRAAKDLPNGAQLIIYLEKDAGWIESVDIDGKIDGDYNTADGLGDAINQAIDHLCRIGE